MVIEQPRFDTIEVGTVFISDDDVLIRTAAVHGYNALRLADGIHCSFSDHKIVVPCPDAKVIL